MKLRTTQITMSILFTVREGLPKWFDRLLYWFIIVFLAFAMSFHLLYIIYRSQESIGETAIAIVDAVTIMACIVKLVVYRTKRDHVQAVLDEIFSKESQGFTKGTESFCNYFFGIGVLGDLFWALYPFFMENITTPTPMYIPIGRDDGFDFAIKYFIDIFSLFLMSFGQITMDNSFMLMTAVLTDKAEHLALKIRNINKTTIENKHLSIEKKFKEAYQLHKEILREFKKLAGIVGPIFLFQLLSSIIMSCFMSLVLTRAKTVEDMIKGVVCLFVAFYELFCYCYFGQKITNEMEELHYELFWSGWETNTIKHKKSVLIALGETWNPPVMKGASLYQVTLRTYMWALKESLSYYMFLRTVTIKKNSELY